MTDYYDLIETLPVRALLERFPIAADFFDNMNLGALSEELPLPDALEEADQEWFAELGVEIDDVLEQLADFLAVLSTPEEAAGTLRELTIHGGTFKDGTPENLTLTVRSGEVISIVGPTGSGKSRLLGDIECLAQGDTPTGRRIELDGAFPDDETRFELEGRLVAQLSQNMNFVMDLSVKSFLEMHARSRFVEEPAQIVAQCFACANDLAGEPFTEDVKVTQLSGGQSRALMIADTAFMSSSPIVLIDEIENAGIDRKQAVSILTKKDKIVFISTHDPLLALSADRRVVIRNGGIDRVIETAEEERASSAWIEKLDDTLMGIRNRLRRGERITPEDIAKEWERYEITV